MVHDVFVSYSSKDKVVADTLVAALEKSNIRCWYAPRDVKPGDDWGKAIADAVEKSKVFLLVFSGNSNCSHRVLDELNLAISKEVTILPFRIEKLDPSGAMLLHLSTRHWLDAYVPSWEEHIDHLIKSVSLILDKGENAIEDQNSSSVFVKSKSRKGRLLAIAAAIAVMMIGLIFGLPKLLDLNVKSTEVITPSDAINATIGAATENNTPTIDANRIGSESNPIIWMYIPSTTLEFNDVSAAADEVVAEFNRLNPDLHLKVIPAPDNITLIDALCDGEAQIGSISAISYLVASERGCVNAKLLWSAHNDIKFGGMVVVRADRNFESIQDLQDKILCVPSLASISGYVLPSLEIRATIGDPLEFFSEIREVNSHQEVITGVYERMCDAGTTYYDARLDSELADVMNQLTILSTTLSTPNQNLSFTDALSPEISQRMVEFFLSTSNESNSLALTCQIDPTTTQSKLVEINDYYYNSIRDLFTRAGASPEEYLYTGQ